MGTVKAHGQLRHRFWGEYSAVIVLAFDSEAAASDCLPLLGSGWHISETNENALVWVGNSEELSTCEKILVKYGADEKKMASLAKSIDYGEKFDCTFNVVPAEQVSLF